MLRRVRGRPDDPPWVRPALLGLLGGTAVLYLWRLGESGWANDFYSAAVQAGSQSWKAFFFGSSDAANFITVDKTPAFLWPMELTARVFGVNTWSILVPQALEGVATVGLLYLTVRRWFGPAAGLLAGAVLALTPVATLMFRYNNPDALLTLLLTAAAYAMVRALEHGSTRWLALAGSLVGWAFLAKMLQALLVVPAFGLVFLVAAPIALRQRIARLLAAGAAMVVSAGWWVAIVELWPAASRPYIGGSQDNSVLNLIFGYNGLGRLNGDETGSVGGGPTGTAGRWGATGLDRLFNPAFGGQISWLLPAALVLLVALLVMSAGASWTDRRWAAALLWGGWLLVTDLSISLGRGIIHPYYTVALAPAIAAIVGMGTVELWRVRDHLLARTTLAAVVALTGWWAHTLLARRPAWYPELRTLVLIGSLVAAVALVALMGLHRERTLLLATAGAAALVAALAGPTGYAFATVDLAHSGALPTAGPNGGLVPVRTSRTIRSSRPGGGLSPRSSTPFGARPAGPPGRAPRGGRVAPSMPSLPSVPTTPSVPSPSSIPGLGPVTGSHAHLPSGFGTVLRGIGGILDASDPTPRLARFLDRGADRYRWIAAAISSNQAAGYQLATGDPVMAIGGFNGTDPAPALPQFQRMVAAGEIHWFIGGPPGAWLPGGQAAHAISRWVEDRFPSTEVDGRTLYDLSVPPT